MQTIRKWLISGIAILIIGWFTCDPLLGWITRGYLYQDSFESSEVTHVYMSGGDLMLEAAVKMAQQGKSILITQSIPPRSVQCGAAPPKEDLLPQLMMQQGVAPEQLIRIPGQARDEGQRMQQLGRWIDDQPDAVVCVLVDAMASAGMRRFVDSTISETAASRVMIMQLAPTAFDHMHWWKSSAGFKAFYGQTVSRIYRFAMPAEEPMPEYQSPAQYEDAFKQRLQSFGVEMHAAPPDAFPPQVAVPTEVTL